MKVNLRIATAVIALVLSSITVSKPAPPVSKAAPAGTRIIDNTTYCDVNELLMFVTNTGSFAYDQTAFLGKNAGLYFPRGTNKTTVFAAGFWMGARVNNDTRVTVAEYWDEYVPGPMSGGQHQPDNPRFRVYKINRGDTDANPDYAEWPYDQGAPAQPVGRTAKRGLVPLLLGDQALWTVFNDADPAAHTNDAGSTPPLGVEVQLYAFAYNRSGPLGRTIIMHYTIINKGGNTLDSAYISLWADPDLGHFADDFVGCDIGRDLGYCYNDGDDAVYGTAPPAVGFRLLYGPTIPFTEGTAFSFRNRAWVHGLQNLPMTSFVKYINGTDPNNAVETFNYMRGFNADGSAFIDPVTSSPTSYMVSGDPVAGTGWLDENSADRRYMVSSGPFSMAPGDTQEVVAMVVVGQGNDRLESITDLRATADKARWSFDLIFGGICSCVHTGDWNSDAKINLVDIVMSVGYLYRGGPATPQLESCPNPGGDVDCSGIVDILDVVYLIDHALRAGQAPCDPCEYR